MATLTADEAEAINMGLEVNSQLDVGGKIRSLQTTVAANVSNITTILGETWTVGVPLTSLREIASNDIPTAATAVGGVLALNTTPILHRINAATNKNLEVKWASGNADAVQAHVPLPYDTDATASIVVEVRGKADATGAVARTITVVTMFDVASAKSSTAVALTSTWGTKTHTITGGTVPAGARSLMVELTPGASSNRSAHVSDIRIRGTKTSGRGATA